MGPLRVAALTTIILLAGCAPAVPLWGGAETTPRGRGDLALGGAVRVGLGDLNVNGAPLEVARYVERAQGSGVAPVGSFRYGVGDHTDLGLMVAGPLVRLDVRQELVLGDLGGLVPITLVGGVGPYVGFIGSDVDGEGGMRVGANVPLLVGIDALSFLQLWIGARFGVEHAFGDLQDSAGALASVSAIGLRIGGVFGLALGFRHLHVMIELTGGWETWSGDLGASQIAVSGAVLVPAFAVRYRF
jgi:hypothetical protein